MFFVKGYLFLSIDLRSIKEAMDVFPFSWRKKRNHEHVSSINVYEKKHQKSFHKGWFIPNEVLQRILFTWLPKLSSFPKSGPPPIKWQCVKLIVPEVCEGDIPCYYLLFPNRLFNPFVDQLHCKFTVLTLLHLYRTDDCWKTFCTALCHTQITEYTFKMHEIKKQPFKALLHRESF